MKKEDVYIPDQSYSGDEIHHGGKWSEEAKQRYREARRAGRSVYDMFANFYNKSKPGINRAVNQAGRTINGGVRTVRRTVDNAIYTKKERQANNNAIALRGKAVKVAKGRLNKTRGAGSVFKSAVKVAKGVKIGKKGSIVKRIKDTVKSASKQAGAFDKERKKLVGGAKANYSNKQKALRNAIKKERAERNRSINGKLENAGRKLGRDLKKMTKDTKGMVNAASKVAKPHLDKFGKEVEKKANAGLKALDRMIETKSEKKYRKEAEKKAEKAGKFADSFIGRMMGKDAVKEYKDTYKRELDKRDKSLTVNDIKKTIKKTGNKALSGIEKGINKGLRVADDLYESKDEKIARKMAKQARKNTSKIGATARTAFSKENADAVANDIAGAWGKLTGNKELSNRAKQNSKTLQNRLKKKAQAEYKKDQDRRAKKYEDQIYDKQIKLPRIGGKKKKKVKHSDLNNIYIPGRTGISETILHSDTFGGDDILKHYGVLGMKWGVRRARGMIKSAQRQTDSYDTTISAKKIAKARAYIKKNGGGKTAKGKRQLQELDKIEIQNKQLNAKGLKVNDSERAVARTIGAAAGGIYGVLGSSLGSSSGALVGAGVGSLVPGVGTVAGAVAGGYGGGAIGAGLAAYKVGRYASKETKKDQVVRRRLTEKGLARAIY